MKVTKDKKVNKKFCYVEVCVKKGSFFHPIGKYEWQLVEILGSYCKAIDDEQRTFYLVEFNDKRRQVFNQVFFPI